MRSISASRLPTSNRQSMSPAEATESLSARLQKYTYSPARARDPRGPVVGEAPRSESAEHKTGPSTPRRTATRGTNATPSASERRQKRKATKASSDDDLSQDEYKPPAPSPAKRKADKGKSPASGKKPRPYAGPEVYAHLKPVPDHMGVGMDIVFCGINPGRKSSTAGHHFAHPTNKFWRALHRSGLTDRLYAPSEDDLLPSLFKFGLTNLCGRPTAEQSELSTLEMKLNVLPFTLKLLEYRPRVVCFVGKKIWDIYESVAIKTALPASSTLTPSSSIAMLEPIDTTMKVEPDPGLSSPPPTPSRIGKGKPKVAFDWTKPRPLRLPLHRPPPASSTEEKPDLVKLANGDSDNYCYFWVVPNTSGLERTPLSEQVILFSHLRAFSDSLKSGKPPEGEFLDINMEGLKRTHDALSTSASLPKTPKR